MAAPAVAGVAALVWTKYPAWTAHEVRVHLWCRSVDLGASGHDALFGYGRVDAAFATTLGECGGGGGGGGGPAPPQCPIDQPNCAEQ